ncbi:bacterioferritin-associated ferredoxin [Novosphingobium kunmingense]|uniref:Bacterioferritin-associated ferredoxin n=1 Tax=Novosphingobium kunmingense TaxID=1211806 RepID=A0A2N0HKP4_9SPHN|nr:(2Fe-2S)-binding protein [Novosphingobium kunmingense]PKB19435.1 bacterioferritin-associated ferredoxin [Novosphingobium kunmingense]
MIICVCNAIRECEIRAAARRNAGDVDAVYAALGKVPQCGSCLDEATDIILDERARAQLPALVTG